MRLTIIFIVLVLGVVISPIVSAEEKFTKDYNQEVIAKYIESEPIYGHNIFFFEKKFGTPAAICYLSGLILLAIVIGFISQKK